MRTIMVEGYNGYKIMRINKKNKLIYSECIENISFQDKEK